MKVIIPLAGFGTRLRPHTWSKPKPLVSVAGKPMLGHLIDDLLPLEPEEIFFVYGWLGDQIEDYIRRAYPQIRGRYIEQAELKGQAHALWLARDLLRGELVSVFADTLFKADLRAAPRLDADGVAFVREVDDPRRFGVAELDARGAITRLVEKPASLDNKLVIIGLYYFRQAERLVEAIRELMGRDLHRNGEFFLSDAINIMLERGARLRTLPVDVWQDCGTAEALLDTNRYLLEHDRPTPADRPGVAVIPPAHIAADATVERAVVGPHVSIGAGAVVRDAIIRDAIVDEAATVEAALVEHSILGARASLRGRFARVNLGEDSAAVDDGALA
jgi:glucose-1-phosphate thymidylyltransferase